MYCVENLEPLIPRVISKSAGVVYRKTLFERADQREVRTMRRIRSQGPGSDRSNPTVLQAGGHHCKFSRIFFVNLMGNHDYVRMMVGLRTLSRPLPHTMFTKSFCMSKFSHGARSELSMLEI